MNTFRKNKNIYHPYLLKDIEHLAIFLDGIHLKQQLCLAEFKYLFKKYLQFCFSFEIIEKLYYDITFATSLLQDLNNIAIGLLPIKSLYIYEEYCYEKETYLPTIEMIQIKK